MNIIIEVRGGVVQAIYSDTASVNVGVLDWDNINDNRDNKLVEPEWVECQLLGASIGATSLNDQH